jgi:hypothetical protein
MSFAKPINGFRRICLVVNCYALHPIDPQRPTNQKLSFKETVTILLAEPEQFITFTSRFPRFINSGMVATYTVYVTEEPPTSNAIAIPLARSSSHADVPSLVSTDDTTEP